MITDTVLKTIAFVHSNNSYIVVIMYDRKNFLWKWNKKLTNLLGLMSQLSLKRALDTVRELAAECLEHATDNKSCFCLTFLWFPLADKDRINLEASLHLDSYISKLCNEIWEAAGFTEQRFTRLIALEPHGQEFMVHSRWQWPGYIKMRAHIWSQGSRTSAFLSGSSVQHISSC